MKRNETNQRNYTKSEEGSSTEKKRFEAFFPELWQLPQDGKSEKMILCGEKVERVEAKQIEKKRGFILFLFLFLCCSVYFLPVSSQNVTLILQE